MADIFLYLSLALFLLAEVTIGRRHRASVQNATLHDRGSLRAILLVTTVSMLAGLLVWQFFPASHPPPPQVTGWGAFILLLSGMLLRWWSVLTLGRFFTVNVAILDGHRLVTAGPYRLLRHPSYTGLLLVFCGLALHTGNMIAMGIMLLPIVAVLIRRIVIEEAALRESFGDEYEAYSRRTWRLIPWVY